MTTITSFNKWFLLISHTRDRQIQLIVHNILFRLFYISYVTIYVILTCAWYFFKLFIANHDIKIKPQVIIIAVTIPSRLRPIIFIQKELINIIEYHHL